MQLATAAGTAGSRQLARHKTQRKLFCRYMAEFTHQKLSLTLRVQFQQPKKPRWKQTAAERISSAAASPQEQPLTLSYHSGTCPTSIPSQLHLDLGLSFSLLCQKPLSVSLSENQTCTWTEECWGNSFKEGAGGCQTDYPSKLHWALCC